MSILKNIPLVFIVRPDAVKQDFENLSQFKRLPQTPCINCGKMVSLTFEDSIDTTLQAWHKIISEQYRSELADTRLLVDGLKTQRMCHTCKLQVCFITHV